MGDGIFNKFKNWITEEEEEFDGVEESYDTQEEDEIEPITTISNTKTAKIVNLHNPSSLMKVVIVEPKKYDEVSIEEVISKKLAVIDMTASVMCMENKMPLVVFGLNEQDSIINTYYGKFNGTKVTV